MFLSFLLVIGFSFKSEFANFSDIFLLIFGEAQNAKFGSGSEAFNAFKLNDLNFSYKDSFTPLLWTYILIYDLIIKSL